MIYAIVSEFRLNRNPETSPQFSLSVIMDHTVEGRWFYNPHAVRQHQAGITPSFHLLLMPTPAQNPCPIRKPAGRGCIFLDFGNSHSLRLIVAVFSLRKHYPGPVRVVLEKGADNRALTEILQGLDCEVEEVTGLSKSWTKHQLFRQSPFESTLIFDSDLVFRAPIDDLWTALERTGLLLTRFYAPPYGIEGTPERHGRCSRVNLLNKIRKLVAPQIHARTMHNLLAHRLDVNVGVMGVTAAGGQDFLDQWAKAIEADPQRRIPLLDEMLALALFSEHEHSLMDETWNCPADEFFRRSNLADARIIHYFAEGTTIRGMRLGRNPATWAGKIWYDTYREVSARFNTSRWEKPDPYFSPALTRVLAHGPERAIQILRQSVREAIRPVVARLKAGIRKFLHPLRQAMISLLLKSGLRVNLVTPGRVTVVLLSYKRMGNMQKILNSCLLCGFVDKVVISNNNADIDLTEYLRCDDKRFELVQQSTRRGPSYRYEIARNQPSDIYICIDDDVFPSPWQLRHMVRALLDDPDSPHGSMGEQYNREKHRFRQILPAKPTATETGVPVDNILHTYVFTHRHLERYFELLETLGLHNDEVHSSEDVIISFAGSGPAVLANVGYVHQCESAKDNDVATHKWASFMPFRLELFQRLSALRSGGRNTKTVVP